MADITDLFTPALASTWLSKLLTIAQSLKLKTTAWQPGGVTRTILAIFSNALQLQDVAESVMVQGGFLDFAATGTVTYVDVNGETVVVPVSPDPSDPSANPTGADTWLDVLASSVYDVTRIRSTFAGGVEAILNTSVSTYGPFSAATYHVASPFGLKPSYSNTESISIAPSTAVGGTVTSVTNAAGLAKVTTSGAHGLTTGDIVFITAIVGVPALVNPGAWVVTVVNATNITLDGSTFSGSYVSGGVVYLPTLATMQADSAGSASDTLDGSGVLNAHTVTQPVTSLVGVSVDNYAPWSGSDIESNVALAARCRLKLQSLSPNGPRGAYEFFALSSQQYAPLLATPLVVSAAITRALVQTDEDTGTVVVTIASANGAPGSGDVTATDAVIRAYALPDAVTELTQAGVNRSVAVVVRAWVPSAYTTAIVTVAQAAVQAYFAALAIGGTTDPEAEFVPNTNIVSVNAVEGAIFSAAAAAKIPLSDLTVTLDGSTANLQLLLVPIPEVAVLSPAVPSVTAYAT